MQRKLYIYPAKMHGKVARFRILRLSLMLVLIVTRTGMSSSKYLAASKSVIGQTQLSAAECILSLPASAELDSPNAAD